MTARRLSMWPQTASVADNHQAGRAISYALLHAAASPAEKGRANCQFAQSSRQAALKESRQTGGLPYHRAALFILSARLERHEGSSENQFVVPPLGGIVWRHGMGLHSTIPPKGGTTNCAFHCFRASQRVMKAPWKIDRIYRIVQD